MNRYPELYPYVHHSATAHRTRVVPLPVDALPDAWRAMLEEMWDGFLVATGDQLTYVNERLCQLLGYSRAELVNASGALLPAEWPGLRTLFDALRADTDYETPSGDLEFEITRKDGERRWVFARYAVQCQGNDCRVVFVVMTDITERRRAAEEREQLIHDLSTFAQTVAHGLKSPLTLIRAAAEVLAADGALLSASECHTYLDTIIRGERTMRNMLQELLLLAGVSQQRVVLQPLVMGEIVNSALERLTTMIREHGAVVSVAETWPAALGYAPWIEEVWVNYISNAIKYSGAPPRLQLGATVEPAGRVRFWVRDNGAGLTEAQQRQLFRPFERQTCTSISGEGLGLSIVAQIMQKLDGDVTVRSLPEGGSEFGFILPGV